MYNKFYYSLICIFSLIIFQNIKATEEELNQSKSFYAISSLAYYLEEAINKDINNNAITFDEQDLINLWANASLNPTYLPKITKAQILYYEAKNAQDNSKIELYNKSKDILNTLWKKMSKEILSSKPSLTETPTPIHPNIINNPYIDEKIRKKIEPFLLPLDHPMHAPLDSIFKKIRAIKNPESFAKAGFKTFSIQRFSFIRIGTHSLLPGYLLKLYLDTETRLKGNRPGWLSLENRCEGALNVRNLIWMEKMKHFSVPDKFLYPLPPNPPADKNAQPVILIVTDMKVYTREQSEILWKRKVTPEVLDELYSIISHGYASSGLAKNIPYTKSGKFSCIDTERPLKMPKYDKAKQYFTKPMQAYWDKLVRSGGKK